MDDITIARFIGLGAAVVIFIVTVILMPWIFGVERSSPTAGTRDDETARQPTGSTEEPLLKT